jgi:chromosome segregation ATPase
MRKLLLALLVLPLFTACNQKELKQLREQNQQLTQMAIEKDSTIDDFVESFDVIAANLAIIKEKEQIISVNASENPNVGQKEEIVNDLNLVRDLLEENKAKIESLDKKLKNSWYQNSKLKKLVAGLKTQIEEKDASIAALSDQVAHLNVEVENLNGQVTELNGTVVALNTENDNKAKIIEDQTTSLHTAHYVIGDMKELKAREVVTSTGGILGIGSTNKLNQKINPENFNTIDITETTTIPVSGKKVSLVTSHPSSSYTLEGTDKEIEAIKILNPEEFWKASKYLVVAVK